MNITCFYIDDLKMFLVNFCKKIIKDKRKLAIVFQDLETLNFFDDELWKFDFLPHCTSKEEVLIDKSLIILIEEGELNNFTEKYDNLLFTYSVEENIIVDLKNKTAITLNDVTHKYDNPNITYMKKDLNSWIKV